MRYQILIDKRKSQMPSKLEFLDGEELDRFIVAYVREYYPNYQFIDFEGLEKKLCRIQKRTDDKYKVLEVLQIDEP